MAASVIKPSSATYPGAATVKAFLWLTTMSVFGWAAYPSCDHSNLGGRCLSRGSTPDC